MGGATVTVIAIDGPAGSGKSTIARALARRLEIFHVDTGAYYRALTLAVLRAHVEPSSEEGCLEVLSQIDITRKDDRTLLNGEDVEVAIRGRAVDANVSAVSRHVNVRKRLVGWQREAVGPDGAVVDGRDAATVIVPDATLKVWLTAAPAVRAQRRADQHGEGAQDDAVQRISGELAARDQADRGYTHRDDDAVEIDTGHASVDDVVDRIVALLE